MSRRSFIQMSGLTALATSNSLFTLLATRIAPVEQPQQFSEYESISSGPESLPDPDEPIETIFRKLRTPEQYQAFVEKHTTFDSPSFPVEFFRTYRRSPEEFQQAGWKGCCNDYAELACNWAYRHRCTPYVVSICPQGIVDPVRKEWHQFAAICVEDGAHVVFDNTNVVYWNGSIEEYIAKHHDTKILLPIGGCVEWKKTQDNWTARMAYQTAPNASDLQKSDIPGLSPKPMVKLAAKD